MTSRTVTVNGPYVDLVARPDAPFMLTEHVATLTNPGTGEEMAVVRSVSNPFVFSIRGDETNATFDLSAMIQEVALHVARA